MKVVIYLLSCFIIGKSAGVPLIKWQKGSDGCPYYIEHEQSANWFQAWEECLNKNMTLLAMDSLYKQQQIDGLIKLLFPKNLTFWLAAHDNAVEKRYVWANTGKKLAFTNWASGQPNWQANDHCALVHDSTNQWHDLPCSTKLGYICESMQCSHEKSPETDDTWLKVSKKYSVNVWNVISSP